MKILEENHDIFVCTCEYCGTKFEYDRNDIGFRPWYPHGFVYCPKCRKPIRHQNEYKVIDVKEVD